MRLSRGSSFEGYRGILESNFYHNMQIIRPLLHISRSDIEVYQQANLVPYQNDPTNELDDYTRNRYRHHILPLLAEENPKYLDKILQFSYYQSSSYELINNLSDEFINELDLKDEVTLEISKLKKCQKIVQIEIIKKIINHITDNKIELSFQNLLDIYDMTINKKPHLKFIMENELYIYKSYNILSFTVTPKEFIEYKFIIEDFTEIKLPSGYLVSITKNANKNNGFLYKLCYNNLDLVFPLTVRNRINGDKFSTESGTKKLKDVLIDKKVPLDERNSLPVFLNKDGEIIFIPGVYKKDETGCCELYIIVQKG